MTPPPSLAEQHEGEQLRDELGRREDQRLGPVGPPPLELKRDTAVRQRRQPLVSDRRAGEKARDVLQAVAIVGGDADVGGGGLTVHRLGQNQPLPRLGQSACFGT